MMVYYSHLILSIIYTIMASKKSNPSIPDLDAFHQAMKAVKPIKQDKIALNRQSRQPKPHPVVLDERPIALGLSDHDYLNQVTGEESLFYSITGPSHKVLRKLRKGQYNVDAVLDLHNMTIEDARLALARFIDECVKHQVKMALIVHGKGHPNKMPILKNKLNHWLREIPHVIAFSSALPKHGGQGALYVLLKRGVI